MAVIRKKELKGMGPDALKGKLQDIRRELNTERGQVQSGGRASNPGRIRELRRTVARILTFIGQKQAMMPVPKTNAKTKPVLVGSAKPAKA